MNRLRTTWKSVQRIPYIRSYGFAFLHAMLVVSYGRFGLHTNGTQAFTALLAIISAIDEHGQRMGRK